MRGAHVWLLAICAAVGAAACSPNQPLCAYEITGDAVLARLVGELTVLDTRAGTAMSTP